MDFKEFETIVNLYLNEKTSERLELILLALFPYIHTVIINLNVNKNEYEDIKQELELKVYTALEKYNKESNRAWGYLTKAIKNRAYELYKINKTINTKETFINNINIINDTQRSAEENNIIEKYFIDLTEIEYKILDLFYIKDKTLKEIAIIINKSRSYVVKKKKNALKKTTFNKKSY